MQAMVEHHSSLSVIRSRKISYHTLTLLAGLLIFFLQLFVLTSTHGDHGRQLHDDSGPLLSVPCPSVPAVRGSSDSQSDEIPNVVMRPGAQLDFKKERKLRYDSSDATVIAMAQGYDLDTHRRFVGSLRKSGFTGNVLLAVEPIMKSGVEEYLLKQNVTILKLNYTQCEHKILEDHEVKNRKDKECNTCIAPYQNVKVRCWFEFIVRISKITENCFCVISDSLGTLSFSP